MRGYVQLNKNTQKHGRDRVGSLGGADRGYIESNKEAEREAQEAEGLHQNCKESLSPLSLIVDAPSGGPMQVAQNDYDDWAESRGLFVVICSVFSKKSIQHTGLKRDRECISLNASYQRYL